MKKATFPSMASPLKSCLYGNGCRKMSFGRPFLFPGSVYCPEYNFSILS